MKFIFLILICFLYSSCYTSLTNKPSIEIKPNPSREVPLTIDKENSNILIELKKKAYQYGSKIELVVVNLTQFEVSYMFPNYTIQAFDGKDWVFIYYFDGPSIRFREEGLKPGESSMETINIRNKFEKTPTYFEKYRISFRGKSENEEYKNWVTYSKEFQVWR